MNNDLNTGAITPAPVLSPDANAGINVVEKCKAYERVIVGQGHAYMQARFRLTAMWDKLEDPEVKTELQAICDGMSISKNLAMRNLRAYPATKSRLERFSGWEVSPGFTEYQLNGTCMTVDNHRDA